jgi:hypothetical protein
VRPDAMDHAGVQDQRGWYTWRCAVGPADDPDELIGVAEPHDVFRNFSTGGLTSARLVRCRHLGADCMLLRLWA